MSKISNVKVSSMEFDLGYHPDEPDSIEYLGRIDMETVAEIDNNGNKSSVTHKLEGVNNISFDDILTQEEKDELLSNVDDLSSFFQIYRMLICKIVGRELGMDIE